MRVQGVFIFASASAAIPITSDISSSSSSPQDLALRMLRSIEDRGQATLSSSDGTGLIQQGIFWQALAVATEPAPVSQANDALQPLLSENIASTVPAISNTTRDAELPLDRFSLGANMIDWYLRSDNANLVPTIQALNDSVALQPRNANGALWYYNNINNLTAYQNLSYLDGMYSYAPYITVQPLLSNSSASATAGLNDALEQIQLLYDICVKPSGLLVHGFDAIKAHAWANGTSSASPEVWGRSLAWFSLGLLNSLEAAAFSPALPQSEPYKTLQSLFQKVMEAQIQAAEHSKATTGRSGVWQVVDRPGDTGNFVEASSSLMTVYTLLRGTRLGLLAAPTAESCTNADTAKTTAADIYNEVSQQYLITYANGSLSLNGTSEIASLSPQKVDYEYYVTRPTALDSLIGTSAFVLASVEMQAISD